MLAKPHTGRFTVRNITRASVQMSLFERDYFLIAQPIYDFGNRIGEELAETRKVADRFLHIFKEISDHTKPFLPCLVEELLHPTLGQLGRQLMIFLTMRVCHFVLLHGPGSNLPHALWP